ncbi:MAG: FAD-binding oxidoreductase [Solirubrobacteraceae bacterium]
MEAAGAITRRQFVRRAGGMAVSAAVASQLEWLSACGGKGPTDADWRRLAQLLDGPLVRPGTPAYASLRLPFNRRYSGIRPAAVAVCSRPADVRESIRWSREHGVPIVTRSGGHSYGGYSATTGLIVDVSRMRNVQVDASRGTVVVGAGAKNTDVYDGLQPHGVAISAGRCPSVGISGLVLGGGFGFSSRKLGLTSDSLVETEMVTASGRVVTCSERDHADLFWACRGGGGGNLGVNTGFKFRVHPVAKVSIYKLEWDWRHARDAVAALQKVIARAPDEFSCRFGLESSSQGSANGRRRRSVSAVGQYFGPRRELMALLDPALSAAPVTARLIADRTFWQAKAFLFHNVPRGRFAVKSSYADEFLSDSGIDTLVRWMERWPGSSSPDGAGVAVFAWGGAMNAVPAGATAFVHRDSRLLVALDTAWGDRDPERVIAANLHWLEGFSAALRPHVSGSSYQNFIDPSLRDWRRAYYGSNLERLVAVKRTYDPDDVFRFPQSIPTRI